MFENNSKTIDPDCVRLRSSSVRRMELETNRRFEMYYMIGAKVKINGVNIFRVLEVVTNKAASLEAMSTYASLYTGVARRVATAKEYFAFSNGKDLEFQIV